MALPNFDALGHQIIAFDVAIKTIIQVIAYSAPPVGAALAKALRDNSEKIPMSLETVKGLVNDYASLVESQVAKALH